MSYLLQARPRLRSSESAAGLAELTACFGPWWRSFREAPALDDSAQPWLTLPAVELMQQAVQPHWNVFEFGGGGSTVFFARRCRTVTCIEHDGDWAARLDDAVSGLKLSNCIVRYVEPEPGGPDGGGPYASGAARWSGLSFERYVRAIENCEDGSLDLVLVDGRARVACVRGAVAKVRPGGMLVLDDSERPRYAAAFEFIPPAWRRLEFPGPYARTKPFGRTTVWIAPETPGRG